jgi:Zn finger protein HypA/HybF involved in hydrogenase expression
VVNIKVENKQLECMRCGFRWTPRKTDVRQCPRCKSAYWDTPKERAELPKIQKRKLKPKQPMQ